MGEPQEIYRQAFKAAKRQLVDLTALQEQAEKKKIDLRKLIESLSKVVASEGTEADPGAEVVYLLENRTLPDEIRNVLKSSYPDWVTPNAVMGELKKMGRDLSRYPNPQSAIQTILKRMTESADDPTEEAILDGKKTYRCATLSHQLAEAYSVAHRTGLAAEILGNDMIVEMIKKQDAAARLAVESAQAAFIEQQQRTAEAYNDAAAEAYRLQLPPRDVNPKKK